MGLMAKDCELCGKPCIPLKSETRPLVSEEYCPDCHRSHPMYEDKLSIHIENVLMSDDLRFALRCMKIFSTNDVKKFVAGDGWKDVLLECPENPEEMLAEFEKVFADIIKDS